MALDQVNCRQEARALQAVTVEVGRVDVGRGHQHDALVEHALEQPGQDHRIADVADEEFVQHQYPKAGPAPAPHDQRQPVAFAAMRAQLRVHLAHEAVEVGAVLAVAGARRARRQVGAAQLAQGQRGVEQVHQEGLAAAHAAPQVQAGDRRRLAGAAKALQQAGPLRHAQGFAVDPVEFFQHRALGRIVLPLARRHAGGVGLRGGLRRGALRHPRRAGTGARRS